MNRSGHNSLGRECLIALCWTILIAGSVFIAQRKGWLHSLEMAGLDFFSRHQALMPSDRIYLVEITDEDYAKCFRSRSPLDPAALARLIRNVRSVAGNGLIGVDIDTSDPTFAADWFDADSRTFWAAVPVRPPGSPKDKLSVLGKVLDAPPSEVRIGVPFFPLEPDHAVRKYQRFYKEVEPEVPSLAWAICTASMKYPPKGKDDMIFNFRGDRTRFPIIQSSEFLQPSFPKGADFSALSGKIILIGGAYAAARDDYATAVGKLQGVELIANAIDNDLDDVGFLEFSEGKALAIDLVLSAIIVLAFYFIGSLWVATLLSLSLTLLLTFGLSALAFRSATYWISFVPIVIGILIHQLISHGERYAEVRRELAAAEAKIKRLETLLALKDAGV